MRYLMKIKNEVTFVNGVGWHLWTRWGDICEQGGVTFVNKSDICEWGGVTPVNRGDINFYQKGDICESE